MTEITARKKDLIDKIAQKYSLELLLLFGSQVSGKTSKESDFDVAYLSKDVLDLEREAELICDLMPIFNSDKVDITNLKKSDPLLRYEITKNSLLLFGKENIYLDFKAFAFSDFIFHKPLFKLEEFLVKKRLKQLEKSIYGK